MRTLIVSWALAATLGFAAHRASICTVRAVAELLSTGRAYCLLSFGKSVLWVLSIILPLLWLDPALGASIHGYALSTASLAGGFLFGMGAALNGGCSFSTMTRLADGQIRMLVTLLGVALGVLLDIAITRAGHISSPLPAAPLISSLVQMAGALTLLLWAWAIWELRRLWLTRLRNVRFGELALASQYRLSTAGALIGIANGMLYLFHGPWTYAGALRQGVEGLVVMGETPTPVRLSLFAAVFTGMVLSTWQRGSFSLDPRIAPIGAVNFAGGMLMGAGAAMVPGGNDALILYGIPTLSSHALPAYAAMLAGIAAVILIMRVVTGDRMRVDCAGDVCKAALAANTPTT